MAQNFNRDSTASRYQAFYRAYRERFHRKPGFGGTIAFGVTNMILDALTQRQNPQSIKETILAVRCFEGVQEPIIFNEFGDIKRNTFITVVRDGQFIVAVKS